MTIKHLVTTANVDAYHATTDKWLFAHDLLDANEIPSTDANIDALETALDDYATRVRHSVGFDPFNI
jgi:hypothetical protein